MSGPRKVAKLMCLKRSFKMMRGTKNFSNHDFHCYLLDTDGQMYENELKRSSYRDTLLQNQDMVDESDEEAARKLPKTHQSSNRTEYSLDNNDGIILEQVMAIKMKVLYVAALNSMTKVAMKVIKAMCSFITTLSNATNEKNNDIIFHENREKSNVEVNQADRDLDTPVVYRHNI